MKKKILATILAASMVMGLAACGGSAGSGSADTAAPAESTAAEAGDTAEAATGEFNPDTDPSSTTIEEIREKLGEEVPVKAGYNLAAIEKSISNEFWRTLQEGYEKAAENVNAVTEINIEVDATTDEGDETGQQTMVENAVNQGVSAIMASPISDANLTTAVENAQDANIPVINVNDGLIAIADYYCGPNAYQNGLLAAEWVSNKLGDEGQVGIVVGMAKAFAARERTAGFKDWIADNNSGLEVVAEQNADWDRQKAKELAATWIIQYPDMKAIFCNNDDMALGVVEAVDEAEADILVVGVDGIGEAYDSIRAGKLDATVDSFPYYMAQVATEVTLRALAGQDVPHVTATPQALIDSENVDKDAAEIIGWTDTKYVAE
ncbi:MAG: substrate-binding domain-containing protein [Lachnospiraceae bacterium]|jgi:ribose transport system substrate-binding protein|nr:substrate-binding domain-containing protein [Lachnospiraceae bacterium]